jgi:hypothetical protein
MSAALRRGLGGLSLAIGLAAASPGWAQETSTAPATAPGDATAVYLAQVQSYEALLARYAHGIATWNSLVASAPPGYIVAYDGPY